MRVPVHILSGTLGTGKTTTLLHLLSQRPGERAAAIVNDFGEARLDATRVGEEAGVAVEDLPGLCVCCTAPDGFAEALTRLLDDGAERIWIEPTGLARPGDLVDTLRRGPWAERIALGPVVVLVDPLRLASPGVQEQAEAADVLVANRCDLAGEEAMAAFRDWRDELWPGPLRTVETDHGRLDAGALDWAEGEGPRRRFSACSTTHDTGHTARSWVWPPDVVFSRERLAETLVALVRGEAGAPLARLKGLLRTDEGSFRVEVAGNHGEEAPTAWRRDSRLDLIVEGDAEAALDTAAEWLEKAQLTDAEKAVDSRMIEVVRPDGSRAWVDRERLLDLPDGVDDIAPLVPGRTGAAARVDRLFAELGLGAEGEVVVVASDGYATPAVPTAAFLRGLLLHSIDGQALPEGKGGPFRLLIPGDAGPAGACSNVKGVVKLVVR
ncbi:MAG: hypothetical protein EP330_09550 [Deltaproteobacteria bacterium]|nr:MAG: hypothetical protein EP330_09550 [Deltaproteobacteria bacterium]